MSLMEEFEEFVEGTKSALREILGKDENAFVMSSNYPLRRQLGWVICTSDPRRTFAAHPVVSVQACYQARANGFRLANQILEGDLSRLAIMPARIFLQRMEYFEASGGTTS